MGGPFHHQKFAYSLVLPVNDIKLVHVLQCQGDLRRIEPSSGFREFTKLTEVEEELPPSTVIQDKIQLILGLKRHIQAHDEGVLDIAQYIPLGLCMLHLIPLNDILLLQHFHGINLAGITLTHQEHLTKTPLTNDLSQDRDGKDLIKSNPAHKDLSLLFLPWLCCIALRNAYVRTLIILKESRLAFRLHEVHTPVAELDRTPSGLHPNHQQGFINSTYLICRYHKLHFLFLCPFLFL